MADNPTDRRSFLKAGALAAGPLALAAPAVAIAADGNAARLAQWDDERAIEALVRRALRDITTPGVRTVVPDPAADASIHVSGSAADVRRAVLVERETTIAGHSTIERMTRFQGHGGHLASEPRVWSARLVKGRQGWRIASSTLV